DRERVSHASSARAGRTRQRQSKWAGPRVGTKNGAGNGAVSCLASPDITAPDPVPCLAEFICVVLFRLEPERDALLLLASMSTLPHFVRLHDEANRSGSASIGNDDPPVTHEFIERVTQRDRVAL